MDGIDRIDRAYRVDPAGHGQRRRRETEEEFREFLERERDEREREEESSKENAGKLERKEEAKSLPTGLPADIVDIRLRGIHNFEIPREAAGKDSEIENEAADTEGAGELPEVVPPDAIQPKHLKIDEIV